MLRFKRNTVSDAVKEENRLKRADKVKQRIPPPPNIFNDNIQYKHVINIKPLSVNEVWQGTRFKTQLYKDYEKAVGVMLPALKLPDAPYKIFIDFGVSTTLADIDNPVKPFLDCLQKKYQFNDKLIYEMTIRKTIVAKGHEYINFQIENYGR